MSCAGDDDECKNKATCKYLLVVYLIEQLNEIPQRCIAPRIPNRYFGVRESFCGLGGDDFISWVSTRSRDETRRLRQEVRAVTANGGSKRRETWGVILRYTKINVKTK